MAKPSFIDHIKKKKKKEQQYSTRIKRPPAFIQKLRSWAFSRPNIHKTIYHDKRVHSRLLSHLIARLLHLFHSQKEFLSCVAGSREILYRVELPYMEELTLVYLEKEDDDNNDEFSKWYTIKKKRKKNIKYIKVCGKKKQEWTTNTNIIPISLGPWLTLDIERSFDRYINNPSFTV